MKAIKTINPEVQVFLNKLRKNPIYKDIEIADAFEKTFISTSEIADDSDVKYGCISVWAYAGTRNKPIAWARFDITMEDMELQQWEIEQKDVEQLARRTNETPYYYLTA